MKIMENIRKILIIALTLVFIAGLVGVLFSPDIRGNYVQFEDFKSPFAL